jgi:ParB/RepB/Spo0J family partition protein
VRRDGILVPLIVRNTADGFEVVDGARRHEIALDERLTALPCRVRDMTDEEVEAFQVILNPEANTTDIARRLLKIARREPDMTIYTLAHVVKKHPDWVVRKLRLVHLCAAAKRAIEKDSLPAAVLFELAKLPAGVQENILGIVGQIPMDALVDTIQAEIRTLRSDYRDTRTRSNLGRQCRLRQLKEVKEERRTNTVAASVICAAEAKTPIEVWNTCLDWTMQDDLASRAKTNQQNRRNT